MLGRRLSQDVLVRAVCRARCLKKFAQDVSRLAGMVSARCVHVRPCNNSQLTLHVAPIKEVAGRT